MTEDLEFKASLPHIFGILNRFEKRELADYGYGIIGLCITLGATKTRLEAIESKNVDRYPSGQTVNRLQEIKDISMYLEQTSNLLLSGSKSHKVYERLKKDLENTLDKIKRKEETGDRIFFIINSILNGNENKDEYFKKIGRTVVEKLSINGTDYPSIQTMHEIFTRKEIDSIAYIQHEEKYYRDALKDLVSKK